MAGGSGAKGKREGPRWRGGVQAAARQRGHVLGMAFFGSRFGGGVTSSFFSVVTPVPFLLSSPPRSRPSLSFYLLRGHARPFPSIFSEVTPVPFLLSSPRSRPSLGPRATCSQQGLAVSLHAERLDSGRPPEIIIKDKPNRGSRRPPHGPPGGPHPFSQRGRR